MADGSRDPNSWSATPWLRPGAGGDDHRPPAQPSRQALAWVRDMCGAQVLAVSALGNGVEHAVWEVVLGGGRLTEAVLRWSIRPLPLAMRSRAVADEAALLDRLAGSSVNAPRLVAADVTGDAAGCPALLVTRLPGRPPDRTTPRRPNFFSGLAEAAHAVHTTVPLDGTTPAFHRYHDPPEPLPPAGSTRPQLWQRAFRVVDAGPPARTPPVFLHRDFHAGNTLWSGGSLTGVVDWTATAAGAPGVDLGHMRWNLTSTVGASAADAFLAAYRAASGDPCADQPYWDAVMVVDLLGDTVFSREQLDRVEAHLDAILGRST